VRECRCGTVFFPYEYPAKLLHASVQPHGGLWFALFLFPCKCPTRGVDQGDFSADISAIKIGILTIKGNVTTSYVLAGTNFGADNLPGGGDDTFAVGTIAAVRISGSIDSSPS
jgi:hypothetical protein